MTHPQPFKKHQAHRVCVKRNPGDLDMGNKKFRSWANKKTVDLQPNLQMVFFNLEESDSMFNLSNLRLVKYDSFYTESLASIKSGKLYEVFQMSFRWFDMWWAWAMIGEECSLSIIQPVEVFSILQWHRVEKEGPPEWQECLIAFPLFLQTVEIQSLQPTLPIKTLNSGNISPAQLHQLHQLFKYTWCRCRHVASFDWCI